VTKNKHFDKLIVDLKERAKELNCLYEVQELLSRPHLSIEEICSGIVEAIPPGWQFPDICQVEISFRDNLFRTDEFEISPWVLGSDIEVNAEVVGRLSVYYKEERPPADEGPFLKEERQLISTIADQLGLHVLHQQLKSVFEEKKQDKGDHLNEWAVVLDLLERTDPKLLIRISRKMANFLCWSGIKDADQFLEYFSPMSESKDVQNADPNSPFDSRAEGDLQSQSHRIFDVAANHLSKKEILARIQKWIKEDRSGFLIQVLENMGSSLADISSAIERYHHLAPQGLELSASRVKGFSVALIRRILSDQPDFIDVAKHKIEVDDFNELMHRIIYPVGSHGKLGGKSSGLFLAEKILQKEPGANKLLQDVKTPKTWYITSDGLLNFMNYNNLEDVIEQKYKDIGQVRQEYSYVTHVFKNSQLSPEIMNGLSLALEDFGESPLIVRSSSLLEDRLGAAFAGKYKSLFIANQGPKEQRLAELTDAIAEVYASTFGPDPMEYRTEQGLLDYHEEMGIMIQEVIGTRVGNYFMPAFAGVAFSQNEFRWSNRIKPEDGLVRLVAGLGTRAVDRLSNDYPILISPGQANLRANVTLEETIRYSPKFVDLMNLEDGCFESHEIRKLIEEFGREFPLINQLVSIISEDRIRQPRAFGTDYKKENCVVTFEGLISSTLFVKQINAILTVLQEKYSHPVDIEFAHDGKDFYLLQCRSQSYSEECKPAQIPADIPESKVLFSASRYISNGFVPNITHLVYVDPQKYSEVASYEDLNSIGRVVGKLNKILPKRQFILMGPGRWGSRGDIKLGVNVSYSEINNTSMLIEIARKQNDYVPDLSFGTHFFQDLVEANIRYLPLYPDDRDIIFNEEFLLTAHNTLPDILPDFSHLAEVIKVIDVSAASGGDVVQVFMNSDLEKAVAVITAQSDEPGISAERSGNRTQKNNPDQHWRWRLRNVEEMAGRLDSVRFGVRGLYLFGSTKNATAGAESDIDILIHFTGNETQRKDLLNWLEGWSLSLSYANYQRTGKKTKGLLDIHLITDDDISSGNSYAAKIGAITDAARPISIGGSLE
jgi:pyruvate, water dikinase